jgi:hypothetical protein
MLAFVDRAGRTTPLRFILPVFVFVVGGALLSAFVSRYPPRLPFVVGGAFLGAVVVSLWLLVRAQTRIPSLEELVLLLEVSSARRAALLARQASLQATATTLSRYLQYFFLPIVALSTYLAVVDSHSSSRYHHLHPYSDGDWGVFHASRYLHLVGFPYLFLRALPGILARFMVPGAALVGYGGTSLLLSGIHRAGSAFLVWRLHVLDRTSDLAVRALVDGTAFDRVLTVLLRHYPDAVVTLLTRHGNDVTRALQARMPGGSTESTERSGGNGKQPNPHTAIRPSCDTTTTESRTSTSTSTSTSAFISAAGSSPASPSTSSPSGLSSRSTGRWQYGLLAGVGDAIHHVMTLEHLRAELREFQTREARHRREIRYLAHRCSGGDPRVWEVVRREMNAVLGGDDDGETEGPVGRGPGKSVDAGGDQEGQTKTRSGTEDGSKAISGGNGEGESEGEGEGESEVEGEREGEGEGESAGEGEGEGRDGGGGEGEPSGTVGQDFRAREGTDEGPGEQEARGGESGGGEGEHEVAGAREDPLVGLGVGVDGGGGGGEKGPEVDVPYSPVENENAREEELRAREGEEAKHGAEVAVDPIPFAFPAPISQLQLRHLTPAKKNAKSKKKKTKK